MPVTESKKDFLRNPKFEKTLRACPFPGVGGIPLGHEHSTQGLNNSQALAMQDTQQDTKGIHCSKTIYLGETIWNIF